MDDPLVDAEPQYSSPAPSSSSPYDSDAYNTADARIHFGPLRSPEKKFVPTVVHPSTLRAGAVDSLLRRSPRLSSPRLRSPLPATIIVPTENESTLVEGEDRASEDTGISRLGTPDNEQILRDEPSSVLASRIIRAHDNPSPPPSAPNFLVMGDTSASASPTPPLALSPRPEAASRDPSGSKSGSSTPTTRNRSVERPTTSASAVVTPDLISFDSFSTSKDTFRYIITEPGPAARPGDTPTIDDLFTRSPSPAPPRGDVALSIPLVTVDPPGSGENEVFGDRFEMTPETIDEQTVLRSLFFDTDESYGGSPKPESPSVPATILSHQAPENQTDTSIQSSSHLHYTDDAAPLREASEALALIVSSDAEMRKKKKREGKRREVSIEAEFVSDSEVESSQTEDNDKIMLLDTGGATQEGGTRKRDRDILKTPTRADYRELGSLSPTSTNLLTQLLPSPTRGTMPIVEPEAHNSVGAIVAQTPASFESFQPAPLFPQLSQTPLPRTPMRSTSPVRFSSPVHANSLHSPSKPRLQPAALDDPTRTPARRIPIDEAVTQGHISPQKAARLTADVGRTPVFNIRPTDSPARRVNIAEAPTPSKKWQGIRFGSPARSVSRQRSASIEPQPLVSSSGKATDRVSSSQRLPPKDASFVRPIGSSSGTSTTTHRPAKLPFPIVASRPHIPSSISEEFEGEHGVPEARMISPIKPPAPSSSPIKSGLKQTTSRIPRGVKPYARPPPLSKSADKEKSKPTMMRTVELPKPGNSARVISKPTDTHTDLSSGSLSNGKPEPLATPSKSTVSSTLKRKRVPEKASPARKTRPVVLLRQVPKVAGPPSKPADGIHVKKAAQPIRRVVERRPEPPPVQPPVLESDGNMHFDEAGGSKGTSEDATISVTPPTSPILGTNSSSPLPAAVEFSTEPSGSDTRRRTTRSRKPVNPVTTSDVFSGPEPRTTQSRRKANAQPVVRSDGVFSGMTAVALKALTSSNTIRNQKYLAAKLETRVIRKEGARPESPAVKIRTISQRMQDEKATQRKERAARRARRGDDGSSGVEQTETDEQSDVEDSSDWDDQNNSPSVKRHKRGPGEEEDYETPIRPERRAKRPRLGEDGEEEASREDRRVKWDRGLFTMIYVDEVKVGTRPPPKENLATKGCLALAAKAAPLDNLGNLPEADSALSELVEESIEVKKFVYDNDVEPLPPVIVVKNTRLRSKKAKS